MKVSRYINRTYVHTRHLTLEILKSHINYSWQFRGEYYSLALPFNPFRKSKYGFYISDDGTPGNARYYRPKSEWGLVEPYNDAKYIKALEKK